MGKETVEISTLMEFECICLWCDKAIHATDINEHLEVCKEYSGNGEED